MRHLLLFVATGALLVLVQASRPVLAAIPNPVKVDGGLVSGIAGADVGVTVFKGLPYAAPPIGDLRWRAPQPMVAWQGVRAADRYAPRCPQNDGGWFPPNNGTRPAIEISEDCLSLNIFTAARSAADARPVIVFVHGGGLSSGAGSYYDGEALAKKGAVVVTLNYRLGVFGFRASDLTRSPARQFENTACSSMRRCAGCSRTLRRSARSETGDAGRPVGGRLERQLPDGLAPSARAIPARDRGQRRPVRAGAKQGCRGGRGPAVSQGDRRGRRGRLARDAGGGPPENWPASRRAGPPVGRERRRMDPAGQRRGDLRAGQAERRADPDRLQRRRMDLTARDRGHGRDAARGSAAALRLRCGHVPQALPVRE